MMRMIRRENAFCAFQSKYNAVFISLKRNLYMSVCMCECDTNLVSNCKHYFLNIAIPKNSRTARELFPDFTIREGANTWACL